MPIRALDGALLATFHLWVAVAVHAFILFRLYTGIQSSLAHKQIVQQEADQLRQQQNLTGGPRGNW